MYVGMIKKFQLIVETIKDEVVCRTTSTVIKSFEERKKNIYCQKYEIHLFFLIFKNF